jgi:HEAT repeat protein
MLITKIFLASSSELQEDREDFEIFINRKNKEWIDRGVFLELIVWEDFLDAMSKTRLQDEYNEAIRRCDIFVMLFFTKVGRYTSEEFAAAHKQFEMTDKPRIFTYFKDAEISTGSANRDDLMSLWAFQKQLEDLGHFKTVYRNIEELKLNFGQQLSRLAESGFIKLSGAVVPSPNPSSTAPSQDASRATPPGDQANVEMMVRAARSGNPGAMTELSLSAYPKAFDVLASVLKNDARESSREACANALANLDDPRKIPLLGDTLVSEKWQVAAACAQALGRSGDAAAVPYLLRALQMRVDWLVAQKSAEALGYFQPTEAITRALVKALNRGSFEGQAAKQSLLRHGSASVPALIGNLGQMQSPEGLLFTIQALGILGDQRAVGPLEEARQRIDAMNSTAKPDLQSEVSNALDSLKQ